MHPWVLLCFRGMIASIALLESQTSFAQIPPVPRVSGSLIAFEMISPQTPFQSIELAPLKELTWIGWLKPSTEGTPYFLVSGESSEASERSIYVVRADGKLKPQRITFPGKLLDPKTRETVHESRAFYGRCLKDQTHDALILYQRDRVDRKNRFSTSLYVLEASPHLLKERIIERRLPSLSSFQPLIRVRQCNEISGRNRLYNSAFFQFRNRGAAVPEQEPSETEQEPEKEAEDGDPAR